MYELLETIDDPKALRQLCQADLVQLADELRAFLIESVAKTGGHLASNLGCVELAIALHYVYNTPDDKLVWDIGHQTYPHKILTGRKKRMGTLRQQDGLSGFPKRDESCYDTFGVGHSSTSIGAALGMAVASQLQGETLRRHVAIIGDGALTAGQAFEGLNNAGAMHDINLLVVLNDNEMSISPNVGALTNYLSQLLSSRFYNAVRQGSRKMLGVLPSVKQIVGKVEEGVKGMLTPGILFEQFGFNYIGPIEGHDLDVLIATLRNIKRLKGPQFLHVVTRKGRGYEWAEKDPVAYHGVVSFNPKDGCIKKHQPSRLTYTAVFSQWLCDMARLDSRLVAITPAMREGSGLVDFSQQFSTRYFDVGIAEQHAITFAAGLACQGLKPVVAIYSTFLQRGYDQLIHDVALQNLPVLFAVDRAGLVGEDGPTHAGVFDFSYLRCIPNMAVMAPSDENECRQMLYTAFQHDGPCTVRYPRGYGAGVEPVAAMVALPWGRGRVCREGKGKVGILVFGGLMTEAMVAAHALDASVADMRFIKPLDEALISDFALRHTLLVCVEENVIKGGAGSGVMEYLQQQKIKIPVLLLGLPDRYIDQANYLQQLADVGLDAAGLEKAIRAYGQ